MRSTPALPLPKGAPAKKVHGIQLAVIGIHPPIAIYRHPQGHVVADHLVVAELGDEEVFGVVSIERP
jgi:hypothetical protein